MFGGGSMSSVESARGKVPKAKLAAIQEDEVDI